MNKRALIFLYICVAGFIISIFLFYSSVGKQMPGGEAVYLGENEVDVFQTYQEAEQEMYYIELAALLSAKAASQDNFEEDFKSRFAQYLTNTSLAITDYTFTLTPTDGTIKVVGVASKQLEFSKENFVYKVTPNVKVEVPYTGIVEEKEELFV